MTQRQSLDCCRLRPIFRMCRCHPSWRITEGTNAMRMIPESMLTTWRKYAARAIATSSRYIPYFLSKLGTNDDSGSPRSPCTASRLESPRAWLPRSDCDIPRRCRSYRHRALLGRLKLPQALPSSDLPALSASRGDNDLPVLPDRCHEAIYAISEHVGGYFYPLTPVPF